LGGTAGAGKTVPDTPCAMEIFLTADAWL